MALSLVQRDAQFRAVMVRCAEPLQRRYSFDLMPHFEDLEGFSDPVSAAVGLTAIQVALFEVLRERYGIRPAGFLGHSAGTAAAFTDLNLINECY